MKILASLLLLFSALSASPAQKGVDATVQVIAGEVEQAGFFISSDGDLLTLYHPIKEVSTIIVKHQNHVYVATLRSYDHDIAHLEIHGNHFPYLEIGPSPFQGEWGLICGYTLRRAYVRRAIVGGMYTEFLLLDTPFNPGEIGGPLLNLSGEVIGINCSNKENLGLSIPLEGAITYVGSNFHIALFPQD